MNSIKLKLLVAAAASALMLSACQATAPSTSEAKAAIKAHLGDCDAFKLTDFDKVNGTPVDQNTYLVDVKYTVKMKPVDANRKLVDAFPSDQQEFAKLAGESQAPNSSADTKQKAVAASQRVNSDISPGNWRQNIVAECPTVDSHLVFSFLTSGHPVADYADSISLTFTARVEMQRTDNGWIEAQ